LRTRLLSLLSLVIVTLLAISVLTAVATVIGARGPVRAADVDDLGSGRSA
jgi:hypothetical protein